MASSSLLAGSASGMAPVADHQNKPINLLRGWPAPALLPASDLSTAATDLLANPAAAVPALQYGPDEGYEPLRAALADWLSDFYPTPRDEARVVVTGGASQNLANVLACFTDPAYTRAVWMVAPCYFLACPIFADAGFGGRLRAVPEDAEGLDLDALSRGLARADEEGDGRRYPDAPVYKHPDSNRKIYRHIIYCVPSFSNPSGRTMSLRRRAGLVNLARQYDALIVCDDVYDMLQWSVDAPAPSPSSSPSPPPEETTTTDLSKALLPRVLDLDLRLGPSDHDPPGRHFGHVLSNGSFSKLVGPGLRTGWAEGAPDLAAGLARTGSTRSGGCPSHFAAAVLHGLLAKGALARHLTDRLRPAYQRRHALLVEATRRVLDPLGVAVRLRSLDARADVFGGFFVWMTLPAGLPARRVAARCRTDENLAVGHGGLFEVHGDEAAVRFDGEIRLCFAWEDEADLVEGVERLGRVVARMLEEGEGEGFDADATADEGSGAVDALK